MLLLLCFPRFQRKVSQSLNALPFKDFTCVQPHRDIKWFCSFKNDAACFIIEELTNNLVTVSVLLVFDRVCITANFFSFVAVPRFTKSPSFRSPWSGVEFSLPQTAWWMWCHFALIVGSFLLCCWNDRGPSAGLLRRWVPGHFEVLAEILKRTL